MTKQANSLNARLAKALTSDTDRDVLFALWHEAFATIKAAEQTVEAESARALDIENPDPDEADATARKARLTIGRLTKAIPRLRERIEAIDKRNYAIEWHKHADELEAERDALANELQETYPALVQQLADLFARII